MTGNLHAEAEATEQCPGVGVSANGRKSAGRHPGLLTAGESGQGLDREAQAPESRNLSLANISRRQRPGGDRSHPRYARELD